MITRCIESNTRLLLEGQKEKGSKLQIKALVNSNSNYLKVVKFLVANEATCTNGVIIALLSPTWF